MYESHPKNPSHEYNDAADGMKRNPSPVMQVLDEIADLHRKKAADYSRATNPFSNFEEAAEQAGVSVGDVAEVMLGIKTSRIKNLRDKEKEARQQDADDYYDNNLPKNEPLLDSYLDRAVYAIIAYALKKQGYE